MSTPQYMSFTLMNCRLFSATLSTGGGDLQFGVVDTGAPNRPPFVITYAGAGQGAPLTSLSLAMNRIDLSFAQPVDAVLVRVWLQGSVTAGAEAWVTADFNGPGAVAEVQFGADPNQTMDNGVALQII